MRDDQDRLVADQAGQRRLDERLVLDIQTGRRLIEQDDGRILEEGARNGNALALAARKVFWTLGMALGIMFSFLSPGFAPDLSAYLFGNILTINQTDLWMLGILALLLTGFFYLFIRPIVYIAFDREFARSQKIPVEIFEYLLMMFIALTIVACLRMVGIVLAISLLTIPQMTANLFTYSFKKIIWLSIGIGFLGCLGGLFISYHWKVPSGASIIFFSILIYAVCKIGKSCFKKQS